MGYQNMALTMKCRVSKNKNPSLEASQFRKSAFPLFCCQYHLLSAPDGHFWRYGGDIRVGYYVFDTVDLNNGVRFGLRSTKNSYWYFQKFRK